MNQRNCIQRPRERGAALLIMFMVLIIASAGLMLQGFGNQNPHRKRNAATIRALAQAKDALIGFAAINGYLPCPDTDNNGREGARRINNNIPLWRIDDCIVAEGRLPWVTLGLGASDAWGNRFRYRVHPVFSNNSTGFNSDSTANLRVCRSAADCAGTLPAVILSHGRNRLGAWNEAGVQNQMPTNPDELENTDTNDDFVAQSDHDAFDDIVIWLSKDRLMAQITRVVATEIQKRLDDWHRGNGNTYPLDQATFESALTSMPSWGNNWLNKNNWLDVTTYKLDEFDANRATLAFKGCDIVYTLTFGGSITRNKNSCD